MRAQLMKRDQLLTTFCEQFFNVREYLRLFWRNDSADLRPVYLRKRLEMPSNDVKLLRYRPRRDLTPSVNIRRALSEDCLLDERNLEDDPIPGFSMLKLSKTRISVGDSVTVYWDIREQCGANDWIGLFDLGKFLWPFVTALHIAFVEKTNGIEVFNSSTLNHGMETLCFFVRNCKHPSVSAFQIGLFLIPC